MEDPPPSTKSVHCVPAAWVERAPDSIKMLWSDEGASGKPGSLWAAGTLQLLVAAQGHTAPDETSFNLRRTRFTLADPSPGGAALGVTGSTDTSRYTDTARYTAADTARYTAADFPGSPGGAALTEVPHEMTATL